MKPPGRNGKAPQVPKSQEEIDQEREDAEAELAERHAMRARAREQARLFLVSAVTCALVGSGLAWVFAEPDFAWGVTAGSITMVVNLGLITWLLGQVLMGETQRPFYAVALVATFGFLLVITGVVIRAFPESAMGFGIGLSVPVMAGMLFGLFRRAGSSE